MLVPIIVKLEFVGRHTCIDILGDILEQLGVEILNHTLLVILLQYVSRNVYTCMSTNKFWPLQAPMLAPINLH